MSLPATGTRPILALLVALAAGGLVAIVAPRYVGYTAGLIATVVVAVLGFAVTFLATRRGSTPTETRTRT